MNSVKRKIVLLFLFALFIIFRTASLTRDLAFEEATYLIPGRALAQGYGFGGYMGELSLNYSPFHKPPMASLFPGLFSFLSNDWQHAGRLFSLLVNLLVCFSGYLLFGSLLAPFLAILSPFLLAAAAHIQTDPTVGLLGISLLSFSIFIESSESLKLKLLFIAFIVLWCGKFELAICATFALGLSGVIVPENRTKKFFLELLLANTTGVISCFVLAGLLGLTRGTSFTAPFLEIFHTMAAITSSVSTNLTENATSVNRADVFSDLRHQKYFELVFLCSLPVAWGLKRKIYSHKEKVKLLTALLISFTIFVVYIIGAWRGDGFPRYYLGTLPPLFLIFSATESKILKETSNRRWIWIWIFFIAMLLLPRSIQHLRSPNGLTGQGFKKGYREAAQIVKAFTNENDLVIAPEPSVPYLEKRKILADFTFQPYPDLYTSVLKYKKQVRAAITDLNPFEPSSKADFFMSELLKPLIDQGAVAVWAGSYRVIVVPPKREKNVQ